MKFHSLQLLCCPLLLATHVATITVTKNATYDDITFIPLVDKAIGTYEDLIYNAWVVGGPVVPGVAVGGVANESPPNDALTAVDVLFDFFFGCVVRTDEGTLGVASKCTIIVDGFVAKTDKPVATASYTFTPPLKPLTAVPMTHAVLPSTFKQPLVNVTVSQPDQLLALKVDNLHYSVTS